ncbi:MAG: DUF4150 domain-containing protein [Deltaproteobacteria bacterium]|nr:DUF4150 domain-containing protein [Deltaproteobacteria bacterium]
MGVTIKVNGTSHSLVHRASGGVSAATAPDVCLTPAPNGPIPIPYPNISFSKDLAKGSKTVFADGGHSCANKGSEFAVSIGDEPGTAGGVKSGTHQKESTWITYSPDVFIEGQNACRLTDKKFQNHGNTVDMGGVVQPPVQPPEDPKCAKLYQQIHDLLYRQRPETKGFPSGVKGLAFRWDEYANNPGGWSAAKSKTHMDEYLKQQGTLKEKLQQFRNKKKRDCDDDDLPPGADQYAEQVPQLGPGQPSVPTMPDGSLFSMEDVATVAGVSAAVGVTVVVISRLIRLIPPLLPLQLSPI